MSEIQWTPGQAKSTEQIRFISKLLSVLCPSKLPHHSRPLSHEGRCLSVFTLRLISHACITSVFNWEFRFSRSVVSDSLRPRGPQHVRLPCSSPTPRACSNSCPLSQSCHPTIASSVIPLSSCLQVFSASGSFQMSQLFTSGGQSIGASTSASVFPMNIQDWFPLGWTGLIAYSVLPNCPFSPTTITSFSKPVRFFLFC